MQLWGVTIDSGKDRTAIVFRGGPGWLRLLLANALFNLLTAGFYRFWARTAQRRYLWAATEIDGEPLEYDGLGREPFMGFLVAVTVLLPLTLGYAGLQVWMAEDSDNADTLWIIYIAILFILRAAASYQARRYRLSRSLWRGIRMGQDGSTWSYTSSYVAWAVCFLITAGLSVPWACVDLARYRIQHTRWGDRHGRFLGEWRDLKEAWVSAWFGIAAAAGIFALHIHMAGDETSPWMTLAVTTGAAVMAAISYLGFLAHWLRWYIGHTSFGPLRFRCSLTQQQLFRAVLPRGAVLTVFGFGVTLGGFVVYVYAEEIWNAFGLPAVWADPALTAAVYALVGFGGFTVLYKQLLLLPTAKVVISSISVFNLHTAATTAQSRLGTPQAGEGLADGFDVGLG